jgi:CRP/FNR family transcriptional regulator, cyclic AMP receptor protein
MPMSPIDVLGYAASAMVLATFCMRTMIPLRTFAIGSNVLFVAYGYVDHIYPVMALHVILLPINVARFLQVQRLAAGIRKSSSDLSIIELLPFMRVRPIRAGEVLIHKGDVADRLFYLAKGTVRIKEIDKLVGAGTLVGEIGIFAPERTRTATAIAQTDCITYELTEQRARQLYFEHPAFGLGVLQLIIRRLLENLQRENK